MTSSDANWRSPYLMLETTLGKGKIREKSKAEKNSSKTNNGTERASRGGNWQSKQNKNAPLTKRGAILRRAEAMCGRKRYRGGGETD